jgi:hypothetical protein
MRTPHGHVRRRGGTFEIAVPVGRDPVQALTPEEAGAKKAVLIEQITHGSAPQVKATVTPMETLQLPRWETLIADVRCGTGSAARHDVGTGLSSRCGWPSVRTGRSDGMLVSTACPRSCTMRPSSNAFAYAQLVETGLRLKTLAGTLRLSRLTME